MREVIDRKSVAFFETQFQRQVRDQDYALNPFETLALDYLTGSVLDFGCGLGNLSLEAGRRGHPVVAVDASPTAVARINADALREGLPVEAIQVDLEKWIIDRTYDTIVAIGLLMFFRRPRALKLLRVIQAHVNPGGRAIVNVLIEGTTYMGMFDPQNYCLFRPHELEEQFSGWKILVSRFETFPAPGDTQKDFSTVIAEKPRPMRSGSSVAWSVTRATRLGKGVSLAPLRGAADGQRGHDGKLDLVHSAKLKASGMEL
jgi:tellurite methyltransferase